MGASSQTSSVTEVQSLHAQIRALQRAVQQKDQEIQLLRQQNLSLTTQLDLLQASSYTFGAAGDLEELLNHWMELIIRVMRVEAGSLLLLNEETRELESVAARGTQAAEVRAYRLPLGEGIAGWVAAHNEPANVSDVHQDPRWKHQISEAMGLATQSILCVPLRARGEVLGVIEVINRQDGRPFADEDEALLLALASHAGLEIVQARLYEEAQAQVKELTTLVEVGSLLLSELALDELLQLAMSLTTQVMRAEASSLLLLDEATRELVFHVALGEKGEEVKQFRLPLGEGIAGWVAQTGEPLLVNDVHADPRFRRDIAEAIDFPTQSIVCVPLKTREQIIGVIEVINRRDGAPWGPRDLDLLKALAAQMAIAIENARLYTNLERFFLNTIASLVAAIDARDPYTHGHSQRVMEYALAIAEEMKSPAEDMNAIRVASLLHDIGKIGTPEGILKKPGRLTAEELAEIRRHPVTGSEILSHIDELGRVAQIVRHHHERYNGRGYPDGLKGENIPRAAQIVAVADALDAMTSDRTYRAAFAPEVAMEHLRRGAGSQFDPQAVQAALRLYRRGLIPRG